jgi:hypothetical protein
MAADPSPQLRGGPRTEGRRWLVYTMAGLLVCIGAAQVTSTADRASVRHARLLGMGTALTLGGVDLMCVRRRQISRRYLIDAAVEAGWLLAWASSSITAEA